MVSKHSRHFFGGGFFTLLILGVVFLGALAITGGLIPSKRKPPPLSYKIGELDIPPGSSSRYNLQLNTLKFKNVTPPALPTAVPEVTAVPTPTAAPTPTTPCKQTITLDFLLDISKSMDYKTPSNVKKIERLKQAVLAITQDLSDNSIIGIQTFNSAPISGINVPVLNDVIPISYYGSIKGIIPDRINALSATGGTPTHDALVFSYNKLANALPNFPGRKFNFILISDGKPDPATQDPRLHTPNPANQIKSLANIEKVYTVGVYDDTQIGNPALSNLLKSIASSPANYYQAQTADDIQPILSAIRTDICN